MISTLPVLAIFLLLQPSQSDAADRTVSSWGGTTDIREPPFTVSHPKLGNVGAPNARSKVTRYENGQLQYQVGVNLDDYGRRVTPAPPGPKKQYALFFGGSNVFGDGLNDDETLPARIAQLAPSVQPYNYGFEAHGPQHLFIQSIDTPFRQQVREETGWVIYLYLAYDLYRLVEDMKSSLYSREDPVLELDENDQVRHLGQLRDVYPLRTILYNWLSRQSWVHRFNINFPTLTDKHTRLLCRVFEESKKNFERALPGSKFAVSLYGSSGPIPEEFVRCLDRMGARVLDYRTAFPQLTAKEIFGRDGTHLSAYYHQLMAKRIAQDLGF